jgi:hypothetical protein
MKAYIQHGTGTQGPFRTEAVEVKTTTAPPNRSATGYGNRVPTQYMVRYNNRWMRVYCVIFSNIGTLYIGPTKDKLIVQIDE